MSIHLTPVFILFILSIQTDRCWMLDVHPNGDQEVAGSTPVGSATFPDHGS